MSPSHNFLTRRAVLIGGASGSAVLALGTTNRAVSDEGQSNEDSAQITPELAQAEAEGRSAVQYFLQCWNSGEIAKLRTAIHDSFTTVTLSGEVRTVTREEFQTDFEKLRSAGWDHTTFDSIDALNVAPEKVHFKVKWSRHRSDGSVYFTGSILYTVTKKEDVWRLQARDVLGFLRLNEAGLDGQE